LVSTENQFKPGVQCLLKKGNHSVIAFVKPSKALLGNTLFGWTITQLYARDSARWTFDWLVGEWKE